ncbi:hypothetical protein AUK11_00405 [bacterium CG2_30_37_16]|nr:MAG: hypothetical protein AUK11_00405 [bacterium CG2_30_37_16]PIP30381.1 MAG: HypC/HybG/HupF family hydrogenase formation chaperone [bacterium (Candidatus Howlettbacteria) CG23_combo_of_CG06-09_8_20_14_all_37_9]PIX99410.1 MAG: HypC/HybG/HupF family hydrogenase formation chaperone [bacterium (Candidatus Howlettbacteria) CG_4_10_14_3_um_filter_37_10]PJB05866.1 MAG: HypC/HybG/HupF family hydrogenase formation chaperone [bacterium (Candidatus Howlettbacteria) CG_4_9_14_3_um_filter_37_10]
MCLAIPGQIKKINKDKAEVDFSGIRREISLILVTGAKVGDFVLAHAGIAIAKVDKKDAKEIIKMAGGL